MLIFRPVPVLVQWLYWGWEMWGNEIFSWFLEERSVRYRSIDSLKIRMMSGRSGPYRYPCWYKPRNDDTQHMTNQQLWAYWRDQIMMRCTWGAPYVTPFSNPQSFSYHISHIGHCQRFFSRAYPILHNEVYYTWKLWTISVDEMLSQGPQFCVPLDSVFINWSKHI